VTATRYIFSVAENQMVIPADYPELRLLAWSRDPARPIPAAEAFALYERNWRFVDNGRLTEREAAFIRDLVDRFGQGFNLGEIHPL